MNFDKARKELEVAKAAVEGMEQSTNFGEFERHWEDFLTRLERVWTKTLNAARDSHEFAAWNGKYVKRRRKDKLLQYLKQARDADQHTIQETVRKQPSVIEIPYGSAVRFKFGGDEIGVEPILGEIAHYPAKIVLLPAINRGRKYKPPRRPLGQPHKDKEVPALCREAIAFYEDYLRKVEVRFGQKL
jgi:hypothetical protein